MNLISFFKMISITKVDFAATVELLLLRLDNEYAVNFLFYVVGHTFVFHPGNAALHLLLADMHSVATVEVEALVQPYLIFLVVTVNMAWQHCSCLQDNDYRRLLADNLILKLPRDFHIQGRTPHKFCLTQL